MKPQKLIGITALLCLCTVLVIGYAHSKQSAGDKKENKIPEISKPKDIPARIYALFGELSSCFSLSHEQVYPFFVTSVFSFFISLYL